MFFASAVHYINRRTGFRFLRRAIQSEQQRASQDDRINYYRCGYYYGRGVVTHDVLRHGTLGGAAGGGENKLQTNKCTPGRDAHNKI